MISISLQASFTAEAPSDDELRASVWRVLEEMLKIEACDPSVSSSTVSLDLDSHVVEFELTAQGSDYEEAELHAVATIRTAIHAAGGVTASMSGGSGSRARFAPSERGSRLIGA